MTPRTLTVLAPIRQGEDGALRAILRPIGDDIRGRHVDPAVSPPRIEFLRSHHVHFARFAILPDPDRGRGRTRLLYSANYDGDLAGHLAELMAITSDLDAIGAAVKATRELLASRSSSRHMRTSPTPSMLRFAIKRSTASGTAWPCAGSRTPWWTPRPPAAGRGSSQSRGPGPGRSCDSWLMPRRA